MTDAYDRIVCPGCGWIGEIEGLAEAHACPTCGYENNTHPHYRMLTLREILSDDGEYDNVMLDLFLRAVFTLLDIDIEREGQ